MKVATMPFRTRKSRKARSEKLGKMPSVWPGGGAELFEEIEYWDFWPEKRSKPGIHDCDFDSLRNAADSLWMASPFRWKVGSDPFNFLASSSLSGAGNPCFHPASRFARARNLGRFASLYADTVLIRDPFEQILYGEDSPRLRADFSLTLQVLRALRTEIEAGVVAFAPSVVPLCAEHSKEFSCEHDAFCERLFAASDALLPDIVEQVRFTTNTTPEYDYVGLENLEPFLPAETMDLVPSFGKRGRRTSDLTEAERREIVLTWVLDPSLHDLQFRNTVSRLLNLRYLTDRPIDLSLLWLLDDPERPVTSDLASRTSHILPFIDGLDSESLLKLRREEGEAFQVYREKVRQLVEQGPSGKQFDQAFRDLVAPELQKIDKAVASARKIAKRKVREKLVFGSGMVTIGVAAGSIAPQIGAILSAFGGAKFAIDLLSGLNALVSESEEARKSDFFFLWKARSTSG
jgi:hypothetical protein